MGRRLFLAVLLAGIAARLFVFLTLPESALIDSMVHLANARDVLESGFATSPENFDLTTISLSPLYYILVAGIFALSGLPLTFPFIKIIPFAMSALQLLLAYIFFRKVFPNSPGTSGGWEFPTAFVAVFPWLIHYGAVNYVETFVSVLLLAAFIVLLKLRENPTPINASLLGIILAGMALSKITGLAFAIIIALAALYVLLRKRNILPAVFFALLFLAPLFLWNASLAVQGAGGDEVAGLISPLASQENLARKSAVLLSPPYAFNSYLSFFGFPPEGTFSRIPFLRELPLLPLELLFVLATLPLAIAALAGAYRSLRKERSFEGITILLVLLAGLGFSTAYAELGSMRTVGYMTMRYMISTIPLLGFLVAKGLPGMKQNLKTVFKVSLLLFAVYSLAYVSVSSLYYANVYAQHAPLYEFCSTLGGDAKVYDEVKGRPIYFYAETKPMRLIIDLESENPSGYLHTLAPAQLHEKLKENSFTHLSISCYRNPWSEKEMMALEAASMFRQVFKDDCSTVYELS